MADKIYPFSKFCYCVRRKSLVLSIPYTLAVMMYLGQESSKDLALNEETVRKVPKGGKVQRDEAGCSLEDHRG